MFKNKMLVLLSLVSFGALLCNNDDEQSKGYVDWAKETVKSMTKSPMFPVVIAGVTSAAMNRFFDAEQYDLELTDATLLHTVFNKAQDVAYLPFTVLSKLPYTGTLLKVITKSKVMPVIVGYASSAPFSHDSSDRVLRLLAAVMGSKRKFKLK